MTSGEMSDDQFLAFNAAWIGATLRHLCDGGVFGTCIDWRGNPIVHAAAIELGLTALNLAPPGGMPTRKRSCFPRKNALTSSAAVE